MRTRMPDGLVGVVLLLAAACGTDGADAVGGTGILDAQAASAGKSPSRDGLPGKTATVPASPCDWISAGEVEAVVGKLNGSPRAERGGCFYPLPVDSITIARRARADSVRAALERAGLKSDLPPEPEDTAGVFIQVTVGSGAEERAMELGFGTMGSWVGDDSLFAAPEATDGWDYVRSLPGKPNFMGRAGTLIVVVEGGTHGMDEAVLMALAGRVRDRVPDLPFEAPQVNTGFPVAPGRDPCSVLSREAAEAVLGKLVAAPFEAR